VTEVLVRDIRRSTEFYRRLGFSLLRDSGDFVELTWEDHRLFLAELSAFHVPIADRYYGLRDFIIADPDGFGVRFASGRGVRAT
jgi:catechol 2,3-dioxygenase-like lactoylglutathione lyase family enzyme